MGKKGKLWQEAYESYSRRFPKSKHNTQKNAPPTKKPKYSREPMVLYEGYRNVLKELKELTLRKKYLTAELKKHGIDPATHGRSKYYDRPILLYVLKLEDDCWYIGMSRNVDRRYKAHLKGKTLWTGLHKPIEIHEVRETGVSSDSEAGQMEDQLTIEYARQYGTDKVRGGGYCQRKPKWPPELLEPNLGWITAD